MQSRYMRALALVALLSTAVACVDAEGDAEDAQPSGDSIVQEVARVINVEMTVVGPDAFTDYIRITGEAEAFHDIVVSAEEGGVLREFPVEKGRRVSAGEPLAVIDASVLRAQVDEARASAALAREQFERQRRLWEDEGIGSEINYLQAKYQAEMADARLATLEARLDKTTIRAPVSGVLDDQYVDPGEIVLPGTQILHLVSTRQIKVTGGVPERYAPFVRAGSPARVTFDIMPNRVFDGLLRYVGSSVEDRSRTFPIEIVLTNPDGIIKPQMVANVELVRESLMDVIVVSQDHVVRSEDGYYVYVVEGDGRAATARARPVTLGAAFNGRVVVEQGLALGDRMITAGSQLVDDGNRVRIVDSTLTGEEAAR